MTELAGLQRQLDDARRIALQHSKFKEQINEYFARGPMPFTTWPDDPDRPDFVDRIRFQNWSIKVILEGAPASHFDWTDPPTRESVHHNRTAKARWQAIMRPASVT